MVQGMAFSLARSAHNATNSLQTEDVVRIGKAMTRAVATAGAFPREGVFAAR